MRTDSALLTLAVTFWVVCKTRAQDLVHYPKVFRSLQPLTVDLNDLNKFTLDLYYSFDNLPVNKSRDLNVLFTDMDFTYIDNGTFFTWELESQFLRDSKGQVAEFNMLVLREYHRTPKEFWGKTREYCVFLWANLTAEPTEPIARANLSMENCLKFRIRIVSINVSAVDTIPQQEDNLRVQLGPGIKSADLTSYFENFMKMGLYYNTTCRENKVPSSGSADQSKKPPQIQLSRMLETLEDYGSTRIPTNSTVRVFGNYFVEYNPDENYLRLNQKVQGVGLVPVRGINTVADCLRVKLFEFSSSVIMMICEGQERTILYSMRVYLDQNIQTNQQLNLPVVIADETTIPRRLDGCTYGSNGTFLVCRTPDKDTFTQTVAIFSITTEPLRSKLLFEFSIDDVKEASKVRIEGDDIQESTIDILSVSTSNKRQFEVILKTKVLRFNRKTSTWLFNLDLSRAAKKITSSSDTGSYKGIFLMTIRGFDSNLYGEPEHQVMCNFENTVLLFNTQTGSMIGDMSYFHKYYFPNVDTEFLKPGDFSMHCFPSVGLWMIIAKRTANSSVVTVFNGQNLENAMTRHLGSAIITEELTQAIVWYDVPSKRINILPKYKEFPPNTTNTTGVMRVFNWPKPKPILNVFSPGEFDCQIQVSNKAKTHSAKFYLSVNVSTYEKLEIIPTNQTNYPISTRSVGEKFPDIVLEKYFSISGLYSEVKLVQPYSTDHNQSLILRPRAYLQYNFRDEDGKSNFEDVVFVSRSHCLGLKDFRLYVMYRRDLNRTAEPWMMMPHTGLFETVLNITVLNETAGILLDSSASTMLCSKTNDTCHVWYALRWFQPCKTDNSKQVLVTAVVSLIIDPGWARPMWRINYTERNLPVDDLVKGSIPLKLIAKPTESPLRREIYVVGVCFTLNDLKEHIFLDKINVSVYEQDMVSSKPETYAQVLQGFGISAEDASFLNMHQLDLYLSADNSSVIMLQSFKALNSFILAATDLTAEGQPSMGLTRVDWDILPGIPVAHNCSVKWRVCLFSLNTGQLVLMQLIRSNPTTHYWILDQSVISQSLTVPNKKPSTLILIGSKNVIAYNPGSEEGIFIFRKSQKDNSTQLLETEPYAMLKKEYGATHLIRFANERTSPPGRLPEEFQEYIMQTQAGVSGSIFALGNLSVRVNTSSLIKEGQMYLNNTHLIFYPVDASQNSVKVQLPVQIIRTHSDKIGDPKNEREDLILLFWVLTSLLVFLTFKLVHWIKYQLSIRELEQGY